VTYGVWRVTCGVWRVQLKIKESRDRAFLPRRGVCEACLWLAFRCDKRFVYDATRSRLSEDGGVGGGGGGRREEQNNEYEYKGSVVMSMKEETPVLGSDVRHLRQTT
jgi:hypothetical protein